MALRAGKRSVSSSEESSLSDSTGRDEEDKTIPNFLRRLRDMLIENEDVISFTPGLCNQGQHVVLGRIVVHDRIQVESSILPRYFNHSSFASLRRQLNYFSFVRLGKGRQRESTYINEHVVRLDDILTLKRRATTSPSYSPSISSLTVDHNDTQHKDESVDKSSKPQQKRHRRGKVSLDDVTSASLTSLRSDSPLFVSEDEISEGRPHLALDLTTAESMRPDEDVLAGCSALLGLASQAWG